MSFLNPVSEPVKRFSSTDADAPQINYNARVAGDVKTVLKACLVTGYGDKASAGWSIVNEVNHVAEFVSPSAAMSDYRLGIDDTSAINTTWYYQFQNTRVDPSYNIPIKNISYIDKTHINNGWQLFVTDRGIALIELMQNTVVNKITSRITYWSQVKSALTNTTNKNIVFFNLGHNAAIGYPYSFYTINSVHIDLETHAQVGMSTSTFGALSSRETTFDKSILDLSSNIYIVSSSKDYLIGELPALLSKIVNDYSDVFGVKDEVLDNRGVFRFCAGYDTSSEKTSKERSRVFLIRTDYWDY